MVGVEISEAAEIDEVNILQAIIRAMIRVVAGHKGYGTKKHREVIAELGPTALHRRSFEPVKSMV